MSTGERRYSQAEVREILRRVQQPAADTAASGGLSAAELIETAGEVGFTKEQVSTALVQYEGDRRLAESQAELRQLSYRRLTGHFLWYLVVNGAVLGLTLNTAALPVAVVLGCLWGVVLLLHLRGALFPDPDRLRERAQRRLAQRQLKESTAEFGKALSKGAARLLSATAKRIDREAERLEVDRTAHTPPGRRRDL